MKARKERLFLFVLRIFYIPLKSSLYSHFKVAWCVCGFFFSFFFLILVVVALRFDRRVLPAVSFSHCINQILESISHIHQHDIVHRDLKVSYQTLMNIRRAFIASGKVNAPHTQGTRVRSKGVPGGQMHNRSRPAPHGHHAVTSRTTSGMRVIARLSSFFFSALQLSWHLSIYILLPFFSPPLYPTFPPLHPFYSVPLLSSLLHCRGVTKADQLLLIACVCV